MGKARRPYRGCERTFKRKSSPEAAAGEKGALFKIRPKRRPPQAILKSPLLLSCDVRSLAPAMLGLLTNDDMLSVFNDPLAQQARRLRTSTGSAQPQALTFDSCPQGSALGSRPDSSGRPRSFRAAAVIGRGHPPSGFEGGEGSLSDPTKRCQLAPSVETGCADRTILAREPPLFPPPESSESRRVKILISGPLSSCHG